MPVNVDIVVTQLLCSKLCHDLVGPIGAVSNGVEMVEEFDATMRDEALGLIGDSARQASARLQFYRYAYGRVGAPITCDVLAGLITDLFGDGPFKLDWPGDMSAEIVEGARGKLLANMILLATEALPRGGRISVRGSGEGGALRVVADGETSALPGEVAAAMSTEVDVKTLTARSVQAHFTALLAAGLAGRLEAANDDSGALALVAQIG